MTELKNEYSKEEFENTFPLTSTFINHLGYIVPKYNRVWNYSNKILLRISEFHEKNEETNIEAHTTYTYAMFMKNLDNFSCKLLYVSNTAEETIEKTKEIFNPPSPKIIYNEKDIALEMIQNNILSCLKKPEPISKTLKKSACSYIYYSGTQWRCFYPTTDMLVEFHNKENNLAPNKKYIDFLSSDEFKEIRNIWDQEPTVNPGK